MGKVVDGGLSPGKRGVVFVWTMMHHFYELSWLILYILFESLLFFLFSLKNNYWNNYSKYILSFCIIMISIWFFKILIKAAVKQEISQHKTEIAELTSKEVKFIYLLSISNMWYYRCPLNRGVRLIEAATPRAITI